MKWQERWRMLIFGCIFGAWIGLVYSLVSQAVNWLFMPAINLTPPQGGLASYLIQYTVIGALLGLVSAIPENASLGMICGGLTSAILLTAATLINGWQTDMFGSTLLLMSCSFLPLIVLLAPIALLIRSGVEAQSIPKDQPHLWARKFLHPLFLTLIAITLGALSLYSKEHRLAIQTVNQIIIDGRQAMVGEMEFPQSLEDVPDFTEYADGSYTLTWSDRVDTFMGPRPAGAELSQFLIIASFDNGFSFACVFSDNRTTPNCAPY